MLRIRFLPFFVLFCCLPAMAQPVFRGTEIFSKGEFAARRARVVARIGDGVAIVPGTTEASGRGPVPAEQPVLLSDGPG
jgi:hypothetical protein